MNACREGRVLWTVLRGHRAEMEVEHHGWASGAGLARMVADTMGPCPLPGSRRPEQTHTLFPLHTLSPTGRGLGPAGKVAWPGHVQSLSLWLPQSPLHSMQESLVPGAPHSLSLLPQAFPEPYGSGALHLHFILAVPSGPGDPAAAMCCLWMLCL